MEQFDILDCAGRRTGGRIGREDAHAQGVWHGAFHCLMVYPKEGRTRALFQRRAREKRIAPGLFDVTVGGHYSAGEDAPTAGPREVREELGLDVSFADLVPVGRRVFTYCFEPGVRELEFQDVFLLPLGRRPERFVLQPGEVDALLELGVEEGIRLFSGGRDAAPAALIDRQGRETAVAVRPQDFVPCLDRYYLKFLQLVERCLRGERATLAI